MSGPDRERVLRQYREVAGDYDRRVRIGEVYRRRALEKLDPRPSNADAACGTGLSFPGLEARVGPRG